MTTRHFLDLADATTVDTTALMLTRHSIADITRHRAFGVIHGSARARQDLRRRARRS
ncbi:MAG: hypothetical protein ACR2GX_08250 [Candidatus Dormibacteria bacterium]